MSQFNVFFKGAVGSAVLFLMAQGAMAQDTEAADGVYSRLYTEFTRHQNRIAGSEALESSFAALEKELRAAGLDPHRQTFPTIVQETERLSFSFGGAKVEGALMTDNGPATWVSDAPIAGPVVFTGNGTVADQEGKDLKGAIAVVDATRIGVRLQDVFMSGAVAVVLVGDESVDQWRMARMAFTSVSLVPRIYVPRESAAAAGLLDADGTVRGEIDARSLLKDKEAFNVWVELPSKKWVGALETEEVLTLSARLDTYGFTPEVSPDNRYAANAALLADTVIALSKNGPLNRKVVAVWFGSHYAAQEGARFFYHAVDMADTAANPTDFTVRLKRYEEELSTIRQYIRYIRNNNVVEKRGDSERDKPQLLTDEIATIRQRLKKDLEAAAERQGKALGAVKDKLNAAKKDVESTIARREKELNSVNAQFIVNTNFVATADTIKANGIANLQTNKLESTLKIETVLNQNSTAISALNKQLESATSNLLAKTESGADAGILMALEREKKRVESELAKEKTIEIRTKMKLSENSKKEPVERAKNIRKYTENFEKKLIRAEREIKEFPALSEKAAKNLKDALETKKPEILAKAHTQSTADFAKTRTRLSDDFEAAAKRQNKALEKIREKAKVLTGDEYDPEDVAALAKEIEAFESDVAEITRLVGEICGDAIVVGSDETATSILNAKSGGGGCTHSVPVKISEEKIAAFGNESAARTAAINEYNKGLAKLRQITETVGESSVLSKSAIARELQLRLKRELVTAVGRQREPLGNMNFALAKMKEENAAPEEIAALEKQIDEAYDLRKRWNSLREQIFKQKFKADEPDNQELYDSMMAIVRADLIMRRGELERIIRDTKTWQELAAVYKDTYFVSHFDFDFANDTSPWMFSMINAYGLYRNAALNSGDYIRHIDIFRKLYYGDETSGRKGVFDASGANWEATLYKPALNPIYKPYSLSVPAQRVVPSVIGVGLGYAGFQLMSVGEPLAHDALPFADEVNLEGLAGQMAAFFRELGESPDMSLRRVHTDEKREDRYLFVNERGSVKGVNFQNYAAGSTDSEGIPRNSIAIFSQPNMTDLLCGVSHLPRTRILANGFIYMPMTSRPVVSQSWRRTIGIGYDENGAFERISTDTESGGIRATPVHMFYAYGGIIFSIGYAPDPLGGTLYEPKRLIASKDAPFKTSGAYNIASRNLEFFADREDKIKHIGANGEMILGSVQTESRRVDDTMIKGAMGKGIPIDGKFSINFDGYAQGANDVFILNEVRLRTLRERNIVRDDLEDLHADAREHIEDAKNATGEKKWALARAHQVFATCIENRIYRPLRGVTDDLVQAVVVLLLLNIPFAFAMERLIFGFTSIYKQLLGFTGFFLATFSILFFTHPAFSLASAPIVIFLAFVIILLSVVTTALMMGKIKQEIRTMQGLASTVHGIESDNSTMLSAVLIGISGMRNRPLKTFLTSVTVVLLTFTILVFASFTSQEGVVESYLGRSGGENRVEMHRLSWLNIDKTLTHSIDLLSGEKFEVYRRGGVFRDPTRGNDTGNTPLLPERVLYNPRNQKSQIVSAIVGYDPGEFDRNAELAKVAPTFAGNKNEAPLYLPELIRAQLDAKEGDAIIINGITFNYAGTFDSGVLQSMATLDDMKVLPPDYQTMMANSGRSATSSISAEGMEEMSTGSFEWFSSEMVAIARMADLDELFPSANLINFLTLYPRSDEVDIVAEARKLAVVFQGAVHVKSAEGARKLFFTKALEGSGFADIIVPLLLGGLIIFSSLMGSIVDREREIFTYSALGLSPPNVGALFFAESAVYSVIGGMGGYLISQVIAKIFTFLGQRGIITPPEMNFSSLTSVCTILIVMGVVMLSTIFPALRASKSANPGVARKWKMPNPEGDLLKFVFPFTVSEIDFTGILSFIGEHFANHSDATLGSFAAKDVRLFRLPGAKGGKDALGIEADVSLAPFDLGIFQKFRMYSSEFEIPGIDEVVVELRRVGGTPTSWIRSNRAFAAELREQFLFWRSLPIETIEHYRAQTEEKLKS